MRAVPASDLPKITASALGVQVALRRVMSRDYSKLRVFTLADDLVLDIYQRTRDLPDEERYGLQTQRRRASVSVPTNIVEGSVRRTDRAYLKYLETSLGSACEVRYLLRLCVRLELLRESVCATLIERYTIVIKQLESLMAKVEVTAKARSSRKRTHAMISGATAPRREP